MKCIVLPLLLTSMVGLTMTKQACSASPIAALASFAEEEFTGDTAVVVVDGKMEDADCFFAAAVNSYNNDNIPLVFDNVTKLLEEDKEDNSWPGLQFLVVSASEISGLDKSDLVRINWLIPVDMLQLMEGKLRLDSKVFTYSFHQDGEEHYVTVEEVYAVKGGPTRSNPLASLTLNRMEKVAEAFSILPWQERRANLTGVTIRNYVIDFVPGFMEVSNDTTGRLEVTGFLYSILLEMQSIMGFTIENILSADGQFGTENPETGDWSGIVGHLKRREGDMSCAGLSVYEGRALAVDFTPSSVHVDEVTFNMGKNGEAARRHVDLGVYLRIFTLSSWGGLLSAVACLTVAFFSLSRIETTSSEASSGSAVSVPEAAAAVLLLLSQRDSSAAPRGSLAARVAFASGCAATFLIFSCFTAVLTSLLTESVGSPSVASFSDAVDRGGFAVAVREGYAYADMLAKASDTSPLHLIYTELVKDNPGAFYTERDEIVRRLNDEPRLLELSTRSEFWSDPRVIPLSLSDSPRDPWSWAFPKGSELTDLFSHFLLKFQQAGVTDKIRREWLGPLADSSGDTSSADGASSAAAGERIVLGYEQVLFLFVILVLGVVSSSAAAAVEFLAARKRTFDKGRTTEQQPATTEADKDF